MLLINRAFPISLRKKLGVPCRAEDTYRPTAGMEEVVARVTGTTPRSIPAAAAHAPSYLTNVCAVQAGESFGIESTRRCLL